MYPNADVTKLKPIRKCVNQALNYLKNYDSKSMVILKHNHSSFKTLSFKKESSTNTKNCFYVNFPFK